MVPHSPALSDCIFVYPQNHRVLWVQRNLKDHLIPPPATLPACSSLAWDTSRDPEQPPVPGAPILTGKGFFRVPNRNFPCVSVKPFPLALSLQLLVENPSLALLHTPSDPGKGCEASPEPFPLQAEQTLLSQAHRGGAPVPSPTLSAPLDLL